MTDLPPPRRPGSYSIAVVCLGNICRSPMAQVVLSGALAEAFDVDFTVDGFWAAVFGSIVISIVGAVLGGLAKDD